MKYRKVMTTGMCAILLGACSTPASHLKQPDLSADRAAAATYQTIQTTTSNNQTMLLVSLEDGSVVMQTINADADICFKSNSDSATTCLTRAEPIFGQGTDQVIGFEMTEAQIDLFAGHN